MSYATYQLARLAECGDPDVPDYSSFDHQPEGPTADPSAGAVFLHLVANDVDEARERIAGGEDRVDVVHEMADADVPTYTHERWLTFVDLAAYNEDLSEYGGEIDPENITDHVAGVALFMVAERLLNALLGDET